MAITMASLNSFSLPPKSPLVAPKHNLHYSPSLPFSASSIVAKAFSAVATATVGEDLPLTYDEYLPNSSASDRRRAGILLHPTSLPGSHGIGDLGFGSDAENPHLPHNHKRNQVVYTGTHDNDTVLKYLSLNGADDISWELIQGALSSVAKTAIIPMQDVLRLGSSARMNVPATQFGNWNWRIPPSVSFKSLDIEARNLRDLLSMYGRL